MRTTFSILILCVLYLKSSSQISLSFVSNDSVRFSYRLITPSLLDTVRVPTHYIIRAVLNKEQRMIIKEIKKDFWLNLLSNKNTDWAANVLLYSLYKKDALLYFGSNVKNRTDWINLFQKDDLKYWKKNLR